MMNREDREDPRLVSSSENNLHNDNDADTGIEIDISHDELEASYQTPFRLGQMKEEQEEIEIFEVPDLQESVKHFKKRMYKMSIVSLLCMCVAYVMVVAQGNNDPENNDNNNYYNNLTMKLFDFKKTFAFMRNNANGTGMKNKDSQQNGINWQGMLSTTADDDRITSLPGFSGTFKSQMYSGYLEISDSKKIFYWFTESENDPSSDPMVLWTNGGPGCSGMLGNLAEHGPLRVTDSGKAVEYNKYRWTQSANIVYIEIPYGVGFSYTTNSIEASKQITDEITYEDNFLVISKFFEKHPSFKSNEFILSGESYAGHYIPQLSQYILQKQADGDETATAMNLKGMLVGNPLVDPVENVIGTMFAKKGRSLIPDSTYNSWYTNCYSKLAGTNNADNGDNTLMNSGVCLKDQYLAESEVGTYYDPYGLDFQICNSDYTSSSYGAHQIAYMRKAKKADFIDISELEKKAKKAVSDVAKKVKKEKKKTTTASSHIEEENEKENEKVNDAINVEELDTELDTSTYDPCTEDYLTTWLNTPSVQNAIHAKVGTTWAMCSDTVNYDYSAFYTYVEDVYDELFKNEDFAMLIYSGDDDSVCGTAGTQYWIKNMGWTEKDSWHPWFNSDESAVAGYATTYKKNNYYVTVHGAGHMVPAYKAESAHTLFTGFLKRVAEANKK